MNCEAIRGILSEFIDGVLEPKASNDVREHLLVCKSCSELLSSLKENIGKVNSLPQVEPPKDFLDKVHSRIQRRTEFESVTRKVFSGPKLKLTFEAVGALATVIIVFVVFRSIYPTGTPSFRPQIPEELAVRSGQTKYSTSEQSSSRSANNELSVLNNVKSMSAGAVLKEEAGYDSLGSVQGISNRALGSSAILYQDGHRTLSASKEAGVTREANFKEAIDSARPALESSAQVTRAQAPEREAITLGPGNSSQAVRLSIMVDTDKININEVVLKVKSIIESLSGAALILDEPGSARSIIAKIPVSSYQAFQEQVSAFAAIKNVLNYTQPEGSLSLEIEILPSK
ncbi:MAG: zf-HC2 domain-containing protein [Candidatus Omnitrophica bacterium]|nr:zf-HC2 domain-containing protein [Candidatus Omnitrophota bacterium]